MELDCPLIARENSALFKFHHRRHRKDELKHRELGCQRVARNSARGEQVEDLRKEPGGTPQVRPPTRFVHDLSPGCKFGRTPQVSPPTRTGGSENSSLDRCWMRRVSFFEESFHSSIIRSAGRMTLTNFPPQGLDQFFRHLRARRERNKREDCEGLRTWANRQVLKEPVRRCAARFGLPHQPSSAAQGDEMR